MTSLIHTTAAAVALSLASLSAQAAVVVTIEDPGVQSAQLGLIGATDAQVETFDGIAAGTVLSGATTNTAVGVFSGGASNNSTVQNANQYGGAGGTGRYLSANNESQLQPLILTLATPGTYFGFWWSAGNEAVLGGTGNQIELLDINGDPFFSYDAADVIDFLATRPDEADFYGNPNGVNVNPTEAYAFLNMFSDQLIYGVTFSGCCFESDNHTTATSFSGASGEAVNAAVPVPAAGALLLGGLAALLGLRRRR